MGAEKLLRDALAQAAASRDFRATASATMVLVYLLLDVGRLSEALDLANQRAEYTRQAGLGPWSQLAAQGIRLRILALMGAHQQVREEIGANLGYSRHGQEVSDHAADLRKRPQVARGACTSWMQATAGDSAGQPNRRSRS